jgi:hypothetical protein
MWVNIRNLFLIQTDYCTLFHTFTIDTTLLALCYYDMFHHSEDDLQGVGQTYFNMKINKLPSRCKVQFSEQRVLHYTVAT